MATRAIHPLLRHVRRLADLVGSAEGGDDELVRRFATQRDEAAFLALLRRHGNMVLGVCQRLLGDRHEAEDAFQATFLVLVRKASTLRAPELVSSWLFGVASRIARKARTQSARRRHHERSAWAGRIVSTGPETSGDEWEELYRELSRLPETYRAPVILHHLEGKSKLQTARLLGWSEGTVSGRLARARALLRKRLARRGLGPTAVLTAVCSPPSAAPTLMSAELLENTVQLALWFAGATPAGGMATPAVGIAQGVLKTMFLNKFKTAVVALIVFGLAGTGTGLFASRGLADDRKPASAPPRTSRAAPAGQKPAGREPEPVGMAEWGGNWWPIVVLETKGEKYLIHYTGYGPEWDEWVADDRLRLVKCEVEWKERWYPAVLLQSKGKKYSIHYVGYDESWDEWVGWKRIRFKECLVEWGKTWWPAVVLETKGDKTKIRYVGYDESWDEWVTEERIRYTAVREREQDPPIRYRYERARRLDRR